MIRFIWLGLDCDLQWGFEWLPLRKQHTPTPYRGFLGLGVACLTSWSPQ